VFVNLANHWLSLGHSVDFVVMSPEGGFREELLPAVNLIDLGAQRGRWPMRLDFIRLFAKYLRECKPDQVFATLTYVTITALWAAKVAGYQGRVVVRQANALVNQSKQPLPVRLWNWLGYRVCYRWADTILVNSKNSEQEVKTILPSLRSKVRLIHNPVVVEEQVVSTAALEPVPVVLASGRFARQKDYPTLLRAFEVVRRSRSAKLIILGDGPDRAQIEDLILELNLQDSVELAGNVSDTMQFYTRASVFVLSSRWEGFPNVLVEALAAGVPVVATDSRGASREIVEPLLPDNVVPVGDFAQFAERIVATLESGFSSEACREYVRSRFDLPVIARRYLEIVD
jgi:glycosyltransferase involved in cell wall biosynthesis